MKMTKYNKEVLTSRIVTIGHTSYECLVTLDDAEEYYNVHVISPYYNDDEMNTLDYQQPIENKLPTKLELLTAIYSHHLWHEYNVDVDLTLTEIEE